MVSYYIYWQHSMDSCIRYPDGVVGVSYLCSYWYGCSGKTEVLLQLTLNCADSSVKGYDMLSLCKCGLEESCLVIADVYACCWNFRLLHKEQTTLQVL